MRKRKALRPGHIIRFQKPVWVPKTPFTKKEFRKAGSKLVVGIVESSSYGKLTGQHTFCIRDAEFTLHRIKGRHAYPDVEFLVVKGAAVRIASDGQRSQEDSVDDHRPVRLSAEMVRKLLDPAHNF